MIASAIVSIFAQRCPGPWLWMYKYWRYRPANAERPYPFYAHLYEDFDEIVTKALTKDKEERYQSAKELFIDLKRLKQHLDVEAEIEREPRRHEGRRLVVLGAWPGRA